MANNAIHLTGESDDAVAYVHRRRLPWARYLHRVFVALMYFLMFCPLLFVVWLSFFKDAILYFPLRATP